MGSFSRIVPEIDAVSDRKPRWVSVSDRIASMIYTVEAMKAGLAQINQSLHQFMIGLLIAWAIQAVICALISANVAKEKGYNPAIWAFVGLLFGAFALLGLIALPARRFDQAIPRIENDLKELRFLIRRIEGHLDRLVEHQIPSASESPDDEENEDQ
jgi:predicted PurR-regulated permease PerM